MKKIDNCYNDNFERNFFILMLISSFFASLFWGYIMYDYKFNHKNKKCCEQECIKKIVDPSI